MSKSVWTGTYYNGGIPISEGEYWDGEARLGIRWQAEDGRHEPCGGWILTNMDTWIRCPICPCTSEHPEYAMSHEYSDEEIAEMREEMERNTDFEDLVRVLEATVDPKWFELA